jgi:Ca2+-binding RTX toxin-like protein
MADINGTPGDDTLVGTSGADTIDGGEGNDTIDAGSGDDTLVGGGGNDSLQGGPGPDHMEGGTGDDSYFIDNAGDSIVELENQGRDIVYGYTSYTLFRGVEVEYLLPAAFGATTAIDITGNEFGQTLYGNAGVNHLYGRDGDDVLAGLAGNDTLDGGTGADVMDGGTGFDYYYVDNPGDWVSDPDDGQVYTLGDYVLTPGAHISVFRTTDAYSLAPLSLTGNEFRNSLFGNYGDNVFRSGGGNDTFHGYGGNDTYYIDSAGTRVEEMGNEGYDTVYTSVSLPNFNTYWSNVEVIATIYPIGVGQAVDLDIAAPAASAVYGTDGRNTIEVNLAWAFGFGGDDTYIVHWSQARVFDSSGFDTVRAATSYQTDSSIEVLLTTGWSGTAPIDLTGLGAQQIYGNDGKNVLTGGALMAGMGGADVYNIARYDPAQQLGHTDILGFELDVDKFHLDDSLFPGLTPGPLSAAQFAVGTAAHDADDRIIYDTASGNLWFDPDGTGAADAVLFATVYERVDGGHPQLLNQTDFIVT